MASSTRTVDLMKQLLRPQRASKLFGRTPQAVCTLVSASGFGRHRVRRPTVVPVVLACTFSSYAGPVDSDDSKASGAADLVQLPTGELVATNDPRPFADMINEVITDPVSLINPLAPYLPVQSMESYLLAVHNTLGTPWWVTLAVAAVGVRVLLFPMQYYSMHIVHTWTRLKPHMSMLNFLVQKHTTDDKERKKLNKTISAKILKNYGAQRWKMFASALVQIPVFITFAISARGMMMQRATEFSTGGVLWFTDLTVTDNYLVLPAVATACSYVSMQLGGYSNVDKDFAATMAKEDPNGLSAKIKNIIQMGFIVFFPLLAQLQSGIFMYWLAGSVYHLGLTAALRWTNLRDVLGFNKPPFELDIAKETSWSSLPVAHRLVKKTKVEGEVESTVIDADGMSYSATQERQKKAKLVPMRKRG